MLRSRAVAGKWPKKITGSISTGSLWGRKLSCLPAIATLCCASHALAAAPAVVADAQQTIGTNLWNPQGVAVAPNGTVYIADTSNSRCGQCRHGHNPGRSHRSNGIRVRCCG